ncbi:MAG: hypothetical protein ABEN55_20070 [Bradymonadaceae bacterium]
MPKIDSHRWTWTLGLLTAASACLLPVGSEGSTDEAEEFEVSTSASDAAATQAVFISAAHSVAVRTTVDWMPVIGDETRATSSQPPTTRSHVRSTRSQLLRPPGPPLYLTAPTNSPPGASV